jgi:phenylalanyl-tRNA synthetase alpha chain
VALNREEILQSVKATSTLAELEALRVAYLGRKGTVTGQLKAVGTLPQEERAEAGQAANELRQAVESALSQREGELRRSELEHQLAAPVDVTAPGMRPVLGHRHPVTMVLDELVDVFWQMGYQVAEGPEVETDWYNFEALLVGKDHPARDIQDTFYLEDGHVVRTHTSAVQIRYMESHKDDLPIRIVVPGKAYRNEDEDPRHSWSFYQLEGLVVDEGIGLSHLKGTLETMVRGVLGDDVKLRLRANYFPYTEPSVEMDATCPSCHGTGVVGNEQCRLCKGTGWLELGGSGLVHPKVLQNVGIDSDKYSGFAFGFGPERIATIKYGLGDLREFWRPNFKFLEQF